MACKFKVGDRVKANEDSNSRYVHTNARHNYTGTVIKTDNRFIQIEGDYDKTNHGWLEAEYFDLIEEDKQNELHITVKGRETIDVYKHDGKTDKAVAKCSPEDTFDFATGVKLVLERLGVLPTPTEPIKPTKQVHTGQYKIGDRVVVEQTICGKTDTRNGMTGIIRDIYENDDGNPYWVTFEHEHGAWCSVKCLATESTELVDNCRVICVKSNMRFWTVGKIYDFKNGTITDDDGDTRTIRKTVEAFNTYLRKSGSEIEFIKLIE